MTAFERHQKFIQDFVLFYGDGEKYFREQRQANVKNDFDLLREHARFVWTETDTAAMTWEKQLAKRYHDKLFKEYCLVGF
jgi:protein FRA10AC1